MSYPRFICVVFALLTLPQICLAEMQTCPYTIELRNDEVIQCSYISIDKIIGEHGDQTLEGKIDNLREILFVLPTRYGCKPYWRNTMVVKTKSGDVYELRNAYYNTDYKHGVGCLDGKVEYIPAFPEDKDASVRVIESEDIAKIRVQ